MSIDINNEALDQLQLIIDKESLNNRLHLQQADLNTDYDCITGQFDIVLATVSLQFLKPENITNLLLKLQSVSAKNAFHHIIIPIQNNIFTLPKSFKYLPESRSLYDIYQNNGWSIAEYKEQPGQLAKKDDSGKPIQGIFAQLIAQKCFNSA